MKKISFSVIFFIVFSISYAQNSKQENIKKLLELSGSGKVGAQVGQSMIANFKKNYSNVPEEFWNEVSKEFNSEAIIELIIPIYDKYYSESDIKELIVFYGSPIGKKLIATMPLVVQESMQVGQTWGKELAYKIVAKMKEKEYIKED